MTVNGCFTLKPTSSASRAISVVAELLVAMMMMMMMTVYDNGWKGLTAEEFITRPRSTSWMKTSNLLATRSRYDAFRQIIAQKVRVSDDAVDLFSVVNHPDEPNTVDLHYSVRAGVGYNLFFKPAKLNGIVIAHQHEVPYSILSSVSECVGS